MEEVEQLHNSHRQKQSLPLCGLAQAAGHQAGFDCLKAQSSESGKLRACINICWARHRVKARGGDTLFISYSLASSTEIHHKSPFYKTLMLRGDADAI